jgi:hypothetical protein
MKNILNKDNKYSLYNSEGFNKVFDVCLNEITTTYSNIIIEYLKFIIENIKIKNKNFSKFIIIRGLDTVTTVFQYLLYYTKNIDITYFYCQKSFYYYLEFVGQISEDEKIFLQLSSRDASTYVYKKTIYELKNTFNKNDLISHANNDTLKMVDLYINIFKTITYKIINSHNIQYTNYIYELKYFTEDINISKLNINELSVFDSIIDTLYYKVDDVKQFVEIIKLLVKKINKNTVVLNNYNKKKNHEDFNYYINETPEIFIKWFII